MFACTMYKYNNYYTCDTYLSCKITNNIYIIWQFGTILEQFFQVFYAGKNFGISTKLSENNSNKISVLKSFS